MAVFSAGASSCGAAEVIFSADGVGVKAGLAAVCGAAACGAGLAKEGFSNEAEANGLSSGFGAAAFHAEDGAERTAGFWTAPV